MKEHKNFKSNCTASTRTEEAYENKISKTSSEVIGSKKMIVNNDENSNSKSINNYSDQTTNTEELFFDEANIFKRNLMRNKFLILYLLSFLICIQFAVIYYLVELKEDRNVLFNIQSHECSIQEISSDINEDLTELNNNLIEINKNLTKINNNLIEVNQNLKYENENLTLLIRNSTTHIKNLTENIRILMQNNQNHTDINKNLTETNKILESINKNLTQINKNLTETNKIKENELSAFMPIKKFSDFKYFSQEECIKFNGFYYFSTKIEYLIKTIGWIPMHNGKKLQLKDIFAYNNCEYFIGYTDSNFFKFTLFKDYSNSLDFFDIGKIVFSPNNEFVAISGGKFQFSIIKLKNFEKVTLDSTIFGSQSLVVFSPDSSYLFYTKINYDTINAYSTNDFKLVKKFDLQGKSPVRITSSQNLYHLIVKDEEQQIKIFSLRSQYYLYLCTEKEIREKLQDEFPELSGF